MAGSKPGLTVGEIAEDGDGEPLAPGSSGARPLELAKADTYSSGGILGLNEDIGRDEMLVKLGKNGAAALGVGLALIPIAKPESGAKTERGEVTLLGLSRADRLNGGANSKIDIQFFIAFTHKNCCFKLPSMGESSGRLFNRSGSRCGKTILS